MLKYSENVISDTLNPLKHIDTTTNCTTIGTFTLVLKQTVLNKVSVSLYCLGLSPILRIVPMLLKSVARSLNVFLVLRVSHKVVSLVPYCSFSS